MKFNYKTTMYACFTGYIVQAIVNSFVPLLFVTFQKSYNIPLSRITLLITVNFVIQLIIDMLSAGFIDRIGYRASVIIAHICAAMGLGMLTFLPELFEDHFIGIIISVVIYAIGGGLIEVLISPIIEACPTDNKESTMSLLHSFYCWGCTGVVLVSTIFFKIFGIENWKILTLILLIIPIVNIILFAKVPIYSLHEEGECGFTMRELFREKIFWILMLMMLCAGASEQAVSQWASTLAEHGLGVSKALGDLIGPMLFSVLMGISRLIYGRYGEKMDLDRFMRYSTILCIISYMCISLIRVPIIELIACGICGFSVGIMWPGTFSKASASIRRGGTVMFAMLALAGDLGCSGGPTLVGMVSSALDNDLRIGILSGIMFPIILILTLIIIKKVSVNNRLEREN